MTATQLTALLAIVLSLLFSYVPKLQDWYTPKPPTEKRLLMLGMLAVLTGGVYGISCLGWWPIVACTVAGAKALVEAFVAAVIANQAAYAISPATAHQEQLLLEAKSAANAPTIQPK